MASSNQGGSILSFLIIGGVLTALLLGGAYFVQQRSADSKSAPVATQPSDESKDPAKKEQTTPTPPATEDKKVATETPKAETPKATPQQSTPATELPTTGPAESLSSLVGLGLLAAMTTAYVRSRRSPVTL
jgi:LPXTG-motif cell wall-anchored protein